MLLYIIIFISKIILIISACPTNCEVCYNDNLCKRCKQNYILVGISQARDNNIISCELPTILSSGVYFTTESGVYYPCSNFEYVFLENPKTGEQVKKYVRDLVIEAFGNADEYDKLRENKKQNK